MKSWKVSLICVAALSLVGCSEEFDPENTIDAATFRECTNQRRENTYFERMCEGKSAVISGFVVERDREDFEYTLNPRMQEDVNFARRESWVLTNDRENYALGEKVEAKVVIEGVRFFGSRLSAVSHGSTTTDLSEEELDTRARVEQQRQHNKLVGERRIGYRRCLDQIRVTYPGTQCPSGGDGMGIPASYDASGTMKINGVCFFGQTTVYFECRVSEYSIQITKFNPQ